MKTPIINIGILAHVDAGKTTITEQLLYASGALRSVGSVDKGTAVTDSLAVEKERGISVRVSTACFEYEGIKVNIIDTPGHVDFCGEVERSLLALDAVVLVVSAVEGVQGHTISLYQAIKTLKIPCIIFINKIDRQGADVDSVMFEIEKELTVQSILLQQATQIGGNTAKSQWIFSEKIKVSEKLTEKIIEVDSQLLDAYLEGETIGFQQLKISLENSVADCLLTPVILGVAKTAIGIPELMDAIIDFFPTTKGKDESKLSAMVFKIEHHKGFGKMCHMRVFDGTINPRDILTKALYKGVKPQKIGQIKSLVKGKYFDKEKICAGDIGVVSGLSHAIVGDIYGELGKIKNPYSLSTPMLMVQVRPENTAQIIDLVQALTQLTAEDPLLDLQWFAELRELHIKITGLIQIEILQTVLKNRFNLSAEFTEPSIIYKETPSQISYGYERYWMPKPCWAILKLKLEPAELGSGVSYHSQIGVNDVTAKYQKEIEATINPALQQGIKGWQVTDLKITLIEGEDHNIHSRSGDFIIATPMAIMNGLVESGTTLLEPILSFVITASLDLLGIITSDITKMRGSFNAPEINNNHFKLNGKVPATTSIKYPNKLASISEGKAKIATKLMAYEPCLDNHGKTTEYRGVSPLDRDKWILQARNALI